MSACAARAVVVDAIPLVIAWASRSLTTEWPAVRDLPHVWWALDRRDNAGGKEWPPMAYSKQFKEQAMRLVTDRGYTPTAAARELGIPDNTLISWLRKAGWRKPAKGDNQPVLPQTLSDDPAVLKVKLRQLEAENRRLRMERDILKKATAYFASQNLPVSPLSMNDEESSR
jgi:transposase